jgi:hypothetical protein
MFWWLYAQHKIRWFINDKMQIKEQGMYPALVNCFWLLIYLSKCKESCQVKRNWIGEKLAEFSQTSTSLWCTGLSGARLARRRTRRSREKAMAPWLKFTGLSGEPRPPAPTVGSAVRGRRVARANGRLVTPNCPVRQRDRRSNGQLRLIRKEIRHRTATVHVRWCTGLSGAPPDRRQ